MSAFKLEYFYNNEWHIAEYCGSIIGLYTASIKWRNKGYQIRCINDAGENMV